MARLWNSGRSSLRRLVLGLSCLALGSYSLQAQTLAVDGLVADEAGKPLAGATVELKPILSEAEAARLPTGQDGAAAVATAKTDAAGRYRLDAPKAGMWVALASSPGRATLQRKLVPLLEPTSLGEVRLPAAVKVAIRVFAPAGKPVAGASVRTEDGERENRSWHQEMTVPSWSLAAIRSLTSTEGTVTFHRSGTQRLVLQVAAPGFPPVGLKETSTSTSTSIEARLSPGCRRLVAALDVEGKPMPGVAIAVGDAPVGLTGADGTLEVAFPCKARSTIRWFAPDGRQGMEPVAASATPTRIAFTVRPAFFVGQVLEYSSRKPIAGAFVWADGDPGGAVRSDATGRYLLPLPRSTSLHLVAASDRTAPGQVEIQIEGGEPAARSGKIAGPTLLLRPTASVRGTVVDEQGRAVAGARIQSLPDYAAMSERMSDLEMLAALWFSVEQRSGDDGSFRLRVASGLPLILQGSDARRSRGSLTVPGLPAGETKTGLRLVLQPGRAAFGRVVDLAEKPVAGATVNLTSASESEGTPYESFLDLEEGTYQATSGPDGRFDLSRIPAAPLDLQVQAAGFAPLIVPGIRPPEPASGGVSSDRTPVDLGTVVLRPGATLHGVVQDKGGRPIAGAAIRWFSQEGDRMRLFRLQLRDSRAAAQLSGFDGRFSISDLVSGAPLGLWVSKQGYDEARILGLTPTGDSAESPVKVVLDPAFRVKGTVLDESGRPLAGASVGLLTAESGWMDGERLYLRPSRGQVTTDDEGEFELTATQAGKLRVEAQARGLRRNGVDFEARELRDVEGIEIVLHPGATLTGRVTGAEGEAVAGARITVSGASEASPLRTSDNVAVTDAEGGYTLAGLEEARRDVTVYAAGFLVLEKSVEIHEGSNRADLRLERSQSIEGKVLDPQGRPVSGASVSASTENSGIGSSSRPDGTFRIEGLRPGSYKVAADHSRFGRSEEVPLELAGPGGRAGAASVRGIVLRLTEGGTVRGRVLGLTFEQLPNVSIQAAKSESEEGSFLQTRGGSLDFQGEYRLTGLEAGEWRISARLGSRSAEGKATVQAGSEARLDLEFRAGSAVAGQVTRSGEPVQRANVLLQPLTGSSSGFGLTDSRGAFRIDGLEAGSYRLEVVAYGSALRHQQEVEVPTAGELRIDLVGATLRGRVVDSRDRDPIARALIGLVVEGRTGRSIPSVGVQTDDDGSFAFADVSPGRVRLTASKEGYSRTELQLEVKEEGTDGVALELQPTDGSKVRIAVAAGAAMPDMAIVALIDPASGEVRSQTRGRLDDTGRAALDALPGRWELLVQAPGFAASTQAVTFPGPEPVAVLVPSAYLSVRVPSLANQENGGEIEVRGSAGQVFRTLGFDGRIRARFPVARGRAGIPNLSPGAWQLTLYLPDGGTVTGSAVTQPGDANGATLGPEVAPPGHE